MNEKQYFLLTGFALGFTAAIAFAQIIQALLRNSG
jgi:hypothetical protein